MRIAIGSKNPTKIEAVRLAFSQLWPDASLDLVPVAATSGVGDQPRSDTETIEGARNRACAAISSTDADFGVGLEGGLSHVEDQWFDCGWAVVVSASGIEGRGTTIRMPVPPKIMELVDLGIELGKACDQAFSDQDTKSKNGFFGAMTNDVLDRTRPYSDAVVSALSIFVNPSLWDKSER